jgi:hypothetical protein
MTGKSFGYVFRLLHMLGRPARFIICDGDIEYLVGEY